ncbi:Nitric oxide-responding transcriptional regulator Dnr (Crp/Fnr family) [hydrothermal vent metagenome]|uniref:Nitric oxide-responding transcriptional regulator Dnr (Crp/Fnr family) n=1 Tax=hydrothermal vent metagenome TaxID=652676 RepID=A0A1W1BRV2_9ZZZZ
MITKTIKVITIGTLCISSFLYSGNNIIDMAGKQRMLSQKMAKDYFYIGKKINRSKASKELKTSLIKFKETQKKMNSDIKDGEIKNLISFVDMSLNEFESISKEKYSLDNGIILLDLSESLLEGSDYIVKALTKGKSSNHIIDIAGKERMLSQRIAKYYIAYQSGIKDDNALAQMKESVDEFNKILKELLANKTNTPQINRDLASVNTMWKIVEKFYLNIEKGGLPKIVYSTTTDISTQMDDIVGLYVKSLEVK